MFVYLDNSATTKPYSEVISETIRYMDTEFGNPSSLHRMGIAAEKTLKVARKSIAASLGAKDEEIYFTAGGTEADNMALFGAAYAKKRRGNKIITSKIEHPAILESCRRLEAIGFQVCYIGVDNYGKINMSELLDAIDDKTILISIMHANNEIGTIQPIEEIMTLKKDYEKKHDVEILFHTDAVQSYGKIPYNLKNSEIDLMSISSHKIHGPKGIGALYIKKGLNIAPHIFGGGQESGMRSGTENVPGIAGFGKAAEISYTNRNDRIEAIKSVKNYLLDGIESEIANCRINTCKDGIPSILSVCFYGVRGEVLLHTLEQESIYVSTGSACSSKKKGQSHVLKSIGLKEEEIEGTIRFSFSEFNTIEEMDYVLGNLKNAVNKLRKLGSFR